MALAIDVYMAPPAAEETLEARELDANPTSQPERRPRLRAPRSWRRWASPLAILACWQLASSLGLISARKVPSPRTSTRPALPISVLPSAPCPLRWS